MSINNPSTGIPPTLASTCMGTSEVPRSFPLIPKPENFRVGADDKKDAAQNQRSG